MSKADQSIAKKNVSRSLISILEDQKIVALGSGSTVNAMIKTISESALQPSIVSASSSTSEKLIEFGIDEITYATAYKFASSSPLMCIDGADQVLENRSVILKGHGGALTKEKQLWIISSEIHVAIDFTKITRQITEFIPIEVIPQAVKYVKSAILDFLPYSDLKLRVFGLRETPVITDNHNNIIDIHHKLPLDNLDQLHTNLKLISGVIETGLFLESFTKKCTIHVGYKDRVEIF